MFAAAAVIVVVFVSAINGSRNWKQNKNPETEII